MPIQSLFYYFFVILKLFFRKIILILFILKQITFLNLGLLKLFIIIIIYLINNN